MAEPRSPVPVLLVAAVFSRHEDALFTARNQLEQTYGPVEKQSAAFVFDQTDYYADEMGENLRKQFLVFHDLISPERLPDIKLHTNALEQDMAQLGRYPEARPINIDPGYLQLGKFLLATTKDQGHRVYLRDGIYAEVTLRFTAGAFEPWPWTYADYRQPGVLAFLQEARAFYHDQLRGAAGFIRDPLTPEPATSKTIMGKEASAVVPSQSYPELFRRVLLGATIALLTARMLAPGEDPGLLQITSGSANLVFPLLWLLTTIGLTLWRAWSRGGAWRGGLVETALLVAVGLVFISAEMAGYKHPARLIAWDWLTLFLIVCLIRQLTVSPRDQNALFAVFLAGAVALAIQAVYQSIWLDAPASATFAEPGAFAAWLALFLPGVFAAVAVCRFDLVPRWVRIVAALLVALGVGAFTAAVITAYRQPDPTNTPLLKTWGGAVKLIAAHPWLGVGGGNFSRAFSPYQGPNAGAAVAEPRNFFLQITANYGVFTLLTVLIALGAFFVRAVRWLFRKERDADESSETAALDGGRWEYLLGGMFGLVLGFMVHMSTGDRSQDEILSEGCLACIRCVIWLAAFVLIDLLPWTNRVRVVALTFGVAAMLLVLCVAPGAGLPAVAVAMWAAVALALNALPQPNYAVNRLALTRILPIFVTLAVAVLFLLNVFNPVVSSAENVQLAEQAANTYRAATQEKDLKLLASFVKTKILAPLGEAAKDDADDARVPFLQAKWNLALWTLRAGDIRQALAYARQAEKLDPHGAGGPEAEYQIHMEFARQLETAAQQAGAALGPAYRIFLKEARPPVSPLERIRIEEAKKKYRQAVQANKQDEINPFEAAVQYQEAAAALERYLPNAPNNVKVRYRLAEALYKARDDDRCLEEAAEALRLDAAAPRPMLTDEQRRKLNVWNEPRP